LWVRVSHSSAISIRRGISQWSHEGFFSPVLTTCCLKCCSCKGCQSQAVLRPLGERSREGFVVRPPAANSWGVVCVGWSDGRTCVEGLRVALSVKWEFGAGKSGEAGVFLVQLLGARLGGRQQGGWHFESAVCPGRPVAAVRNGSNFPASFECPIAFVFCTPALSEIRPSTEMDWAKAQPVGGRFAKIWS
jgi:hypothetical protein